MKGSILLCLAVTAGLSSGCVSTERSRETANPATPPATLAAQVCSNCHGLNGSATSPNFPNLAAQQEAYFVTQLTAFRSQGRSDPAGFEYMWGLSKHLTDDQIKGLAAYFAKQKPPVFPSGDASLASSGKEIFEHGVAEKNIPPCGSCHGDHGQGNEQFPRLAGQHSDYVLKQLMVFQRTDQRPEGAIMKTIAHDLTSAQMKAVAAYVQGISPQ